MSPIKVGNIHPGAELTLIGAVRVNLLQELLLRALGIMDHKKEKKKFGLKKKSVWGGFCRSQFPQKDEKSNGTI